MSNHNQIKINSIKPIKDNVFVSDLDHGPRKSPIGLILPDDDGKDRGIRNRWGRVYAVGPDVTDLVAGEWVLIMHGRWTNGIEFSTPDGDLTLWRIEYPEAVLLVTDEDPREYKVTSF